MQAVSMLWSSLILNFKLCLLKILDILMKSVASTVMASSGNRSVFW